MDVTLSVQMLSAPSAAINMPATRSTSQPSHEEILMDLKEVQSFLYMVVGSHIKLDEGRNASGQGINAYA